MEREVNHHLWSMEKLGAFEDRMGWDGEAILKTIEYVGGEEVVSRKERDRDHEKEYDLVCIKTNSQGNHAIFTS